MKTLNLNQLPVEELTNQELLEFEGGTTCNSGCNDGGGGSLISVGNISATNLVTLNTHVWNNNIANGNDVLSSSDACGC